MSDPFTIEVEEGSMAVEIILGGTSGRIETSMYIEDYMTFFHGLDIKLATWRAGTSNSMNFYGHITNGDFGLYINRECITMEAGGFGSGEGGSHNTKIYLSEQDMPTLEAFLDKVIILMNKL